MIAKVLNHDSSNAPIIVVLGAPSSVSVGDVVQGLARVRQKDVASGLR